MFIDVVCYFTAGASTNAEYRDLTFQELMMQRERILSERNIISQRLSLLDDIIKAKIEENQYVTTSTGANSKKETCIDEESGSQKPSPRRYVSNVKQRQLDDIFLGREISFPSNRSIQESDGGSSLLDAARKTAQLIESSTNFPPTMLTPHDAWYLTPFPQHDFSTNAVQEESTEDILASAAAGLNLSSKTPNHASTDDAAQATSSGHKGVEGLTVRSDRSPALSKCTDEDKGTQEVDDRKPHADNEDDVG